MCAWLCLRGFLYFKCVDLITPHRNCVSQTFVFIYFLFVARSSVEHAIWYGRDRSMRTYYVPIHGSILIFIVHLHCAIFLLSFIWMLLLLLVLFDFCVLLKWNTAFICSNIELLWNGIYDNVQSDAILYVIMCEFCVASSVCVFKLSDLLFHCLIS